MNEEYDPNKESSYIIPFDANNLYGSARSQPLPSGQYEWINPSNITLYFIKKYDFETCESGYILEVGLGYPRELHGEHNEFPLAPEVMCVRANMLSKYQRELYSTIYDKSPSDSVSPKLSVNLYDKQNMFFILLIFNYILIWVWF